MGNDMNKPVAWIDEETGCFVYSQYDYEDLDEHGKDGLIPLYTHPVKEQETLINWIYDNGNWEAGRTDDRIFVESSDFTHDVRLYVDGDFEDIPQKYAYATEIAKRLNVSHPVKEPTDLELLKMIGEQFTRFGFEGDYVVEDSELIDFAKAILRKAQEK